MVPEDIGRAAAQLLLDEVARGGVTDGTHQGLLLLLAALGPEEMNQVCACTCLLVLWLPEAWRHCLCRTWPAPDGACHACCLLLCVLLRCGWGR